ncbi:SAM-dependent methyltransferase [Paracidovorax avenae]|nr:SAM-dependent methyltransferase [Paracidovorax avenae]
MRNPPDRYLMTLHQHFPAAPAFTLDESSGWTVTTEAANAPPATTHQAAQSIAFQRWFHFKEAFSPSFVTTAVQTLGFAPERVIDPFGGSGTTAITCQLMGINATTIEVNPFLADVIRAKTRPIDQEVLISAVKSFRHGLARTKPDLKVLSHLPPTFIEGDGKQRWIFSQSLAERLSQYLKCIRQIADPDVRRFFRVALGAVLVDCSNIYVNGKGRRYRGNWQETQANGAMLDFRFHNQFNTAFEDVHRFAARPDADIQVLQGDSRSAMQGLQQSADLIVFSPPYPNSFDYTDIYNVELWTLGYLTSSADNSRLRRSTVHSHVQIQRLAQRPVHESATLCAAVQELVQRRNDLWDQRIPEMIQGYFCDLERVLEESFRLVTARGKVLMVVGDSRYVGVLIDVPKILVELGEKLGFRKAHIYEVRKMRASAQQGGSHHLRECIVELAR